MTLGSMLVLAAAVFAGTGEYDRLQRQVDELDAAADRAWENCPDKAAFEKRKEEMRKAFIDGIGGFPERTPLNARTTAIVKRDGYTIEKVLFESQPKHYVTALAFVPDPARFKAPYPAVLVPCGHSRGGKDSAGYQRACVSRIRLAGTAVLATATTRPVSRRCASAARRRASGSGTASAPLTISALAKTWTELVSAAWATPAAVRSLRI